jgi:hypothetical protein
MITYVIVSVVGGILLIIMDGVMNANPIAQRLNEVYKPIARTSLNIVAGVAIDLVYGFIMTAVFLLLYTSLPGESGIVKGLSYAILVWFFRVVMSAASTWLMFTVPSRTLVYNLSAGLVEILAIGTLFGLTLHPQA